MRKEKASICTSIFVILTALFSVSLLSCRQSGSRGEPRVVLYCSVDQGIAEPIIAEFERQSGIEVSARFDTEASKTVGLIQKIRAEAASPIADVFWSSEVFHTIRLARESLLAPYIGERTKPWPALFRDADGYWYGFGLRARVIAYNTKKVTLDEAPKTLEDTLDPRWRQRLVMARPEFGTTGGDVASWFVHYGPERAREILEVLKANKVHLVEGNSTAVRMVATGQADVCFTDTDDVYAAQRNSWPVAMNFLDQGGAGALVIPNTAAVVNGAPHPEPAKKLMEFLLSDECERMLAESDSHNTPIHPSLAEEFEEYGIAKRLEVEYEKVADQLPAAIKAAGEVLR